MSAPPVRGPQDVPDLRLWLLDQWRNGGPLDDVSRILRPIHKRDDDRVSVLEPLFDRRALTDAALWWVSADMTDLLNRVAPTLNVTLRDDMIPDKAGLVIFEKPLMGHDANTADHMVRVDAILWGETFLPPLFPEIPKMGGCAAVGIASYRHHRLDEEIQPLERALALTVAMEAVFDKNIGDMWIPIGRTDWLHGDTCEAPTIPDLPQYQNDSMTEDRRWLAALWLLANQKNITTVSETVPSRPVRRRSERKGQSAGVRIIDLRHQAARAVSTGHRDVEWSKRWVVSEHWRHNRRTGEKDILVHAYIKGPDDKPLVVKPTVKVVR